MKSLKTDLDCCITYVRMDDEAIVTELDACPLDDSPSVIGEYGAFESFYVGTAFMPACLVSEEGEPLCFETVIVRKFVRKVVGLHSDYREAMRFHDGVVAHRASLM